MSQTSNRHLNPPTHRVWAFGLFFAHLPLLVTFVVVFSVVDSTVTGVSDWSAYFTNNQDALADSLLVSSILVAAFVVLLGRWQVSLLSALQPPVIQAAFIFGLPDRALCDGIPLLLITVVPLGLVAWLFRSELSRLYDRPSTEAD